MTKATESTHVILLNLGGPSNQSEIRRFLFNLFNDKYILTLPAIPRAVLAFTISTFRVKSSTREYSKIGGQSPILQNTQEQAKLLSRSLGSGFRIHVAMRYSNPSIKTIVSHIARSSSKSRRVILLPLYPQFSITTSYSASDEFRKLCKKFHLYNTTCINSFHANPQYLKSCTNLILQSASKIKDPSKKTVILFSAHGIPKLFITKYQDLYQQHVEETASSIQLLLRGSNHPNIPSSTEYKICYQSRVGPTEWLRPYIQDTIPKYKDHNIIIFPIAFVSEHLETLVELDVEYSQLAQSSGATQYIRVPTPSNCPLFISSLAQEILKYS